MKDWGEKFILNINDEKGTLFGFEGTARDFDGVIRYLREIAVSGGHETSPVIEFLGGSVGAGTRDGSVLNSGALYSATEILLTTTLPLECGERAPTGPLPVLRQIETISLRRRNRHASGQAQADL